MRNLTLVIILLLSLAFAPAGFAQNMHSFQNGIFKETEPKQKTGNADIQLSDFSYQPQNGQNGTSVWDLPRNNAGIAFATSAILPGAGQAFNKKWIRASVYFAIEAASIYIYTDLSNKARRQEKAYEAYTHQNWSVMAYSQWLVQYSDQNNINQDRLDELRDQVFENNRRLAPNWNDTREDWNKVNIGLLREVEEETPFVYETRRSDNSFSHHLPDYGSQQYYELISKYYQYQPGWKDWYGEITTAENQTPDMYYYMWNGRDEPNDMFYEGRDRAEAFNDNYRIAGNFLKLLIVNHVVSAFDAFITVKLKNSRIETEANALSMEQLSLTWHF